MQAIEWLTLLLFGGLVGMVGQGIRVAVGLKKVNDTAQEKGVAFSEVFKPNELLVSLLIGFVAGALGILSLRQVGETAGTFDTENVIALIGIGYAGTDFIEAFVKKSLPNAGGSASRSSPTPVADGVALPEQPVG
jgi:hypothetical protein